MNQKIPIPIIHMVRNTLNIMNTRNTLGESGGGNSGSRGGTWPVDTTRGGILLCQQWTRCLNPTVEAAAGFWRPSRPLKLG